MENAGSCVLDALFTGNFEHILERIFFSLDYKSFKTCCEVNKTWRERLTSERFRANFHSAISDDERELILASMRGDVRGARRHVTGHTRAQILTAIWCTALPMSPVTLSTSPNHIRSGRIQ